MGVVLSDDISTVLSEEDENMIGISFESALCSVDRGATERGVVKTKNPHKSHTKKQKKKSKLKVSMEETVGASSLMRKRKSKVPSKLDFSQFHLKHPTVKLVRTPTKPHSGVGFPLTPESDEVVSHDTVSQVCETSPDDRHSNAGPPSSSRSGSTDPSNEREKTRKAITPSYLPSGPLINLTKVAAKHKKMSYVSLVGKHAERAVARKRVPPTPPPTVSTPPTEPMFGIIRRKAIVLTGKCSIHQLNTHTHIYICIYTHTCTHTHTHLSLIHI